MEMAETEKESNGKAALSTSPQMDIAGFLYILYACKHVYTTLRGTTLDDCLTL